VEELERGHEQPAVRVVLVDFLCKGLFVRVAGLASLTGPGLVRPGHGRPPSVVCVPALDELGSAELLFATQC
jgi:hypothetical protein